MVRKIWLLVLGAAALLSLTHPASAQIIVPGGKVPKLDGIPPDLQKQLQNIFQQAGAGQLQPGIRGGKAGLRWGGLRLEKPTPELQMQLGLEANEGLVIAAVDPNSVGQKAGVEMNDVLLKIGDKAVPSDPAGLALLVKDQKDNQPLDLVVIRKGKQETIKGARMPAFVQNTGAFGGGGRGIGGGGGGIGGRGIGGGIGGRGIGGAGGAGRPGIALPFNPLQPGKLDKLHIEMTVNGAKLIKKQDGDAFSGEYAKDELKIAISGKIENGQNKISEITVTEGKQTKKYASPQEVPAHHRATIQQLMPSPFNNLMVLPSILDLQNFPGLPVIPGIDN